MICKQLLPILFDLRSILVILFIVKSVSIYSVHPSSIPLFLKQIECKDLISTIRLKNSRNSCLLNPFIKFKLLINGTHSDRCAQPYEIYFLQKKMWEVFYLHLFLKANLVCQLQYENPRLAVLLFHKKEMEEKEFKKPLCLVILTMTLA